MAMKWRYRGIAISNMAIPLYRHYRGIAMISKMVIRGIAISNMAIPLYRHYRGIAMISKMAILRSEGAVRAAVSPFLKWRYRVTRVPFALWHAISKTAIPFTMVSP
jgi:hypothetical protein